MKLIPLTQGLFAKVDDEDFERVVNFGRWRAVHIRHTFYAVCTKLGIQFYMHRFIMGDKVDHASRDGLDNQKNNLRKATSSQNAANKPKQEGEYTSKYKGVNRKGNRWIARLGVDNTRVALGVFSTEEEAAKAYNEAAKKQFGEFALLNDLC